MSDSAAERLALLHWLRRLERRRRAWMLVQYSIGVAILMLLAFLVLCATDRLMALPALARGAVAVIVIALAALAEIVIVLRCLQSFNPVTAAQAVERWRPALDERLITLAALPIGVDPMLEQRLRSGVREVLTGQPLQVAWPVRNTVFLSAAAMMMSTAIGSFIYGVGWQRTAQRVVQPWAALTPISSQTLRLTPGDTVLARSDASITMEAELLGSEGDNEPVLLHVQDGLGETSIAMMPHGHNHFVRTLSGLLQNVRVFATAGETRSQTVRITLSAMPATRLIKGRRG